MSSTKVPVQRPPAKPKETSEKCVVEEYLATLGVGRETLLD